jgi:multicomponent Na+:H+ antiporter subunit G
MTTTLLIDALSALVFVAGGVFVLVGGIGALRMPDVYTRIHGAGLTDTMGTILVLAACTLQAGSWLAAVKIAAVLVFLLLTTPTATYALANAARLAGVTPARSGTGSVEPPP